MSSLVVAQNQALKNLGALLVADRINLYHNQHAT